MVVHRHGKSSCITTGILSVSKPTPVPLPDCPPSHRRGTRSVSWFLSPFSFCPLLFAFVCLLLAFSIAPAAASPVFPFAPDPAACLQEPISLDAASNLLATPTAAATPMTRLPEGLPVSDIVAIEIERVIVEIFACLNGGEPLRSYTLYTDDYLRQILAGADLVALSTPLPLDPEERTTILEIRDLRELPDGRVSATVVLDPALIPVDKMFVFIMIENNGAWLVDDVLDELEFSLP